MSFLILHRMITILSIVIAQQSIQIICPGAQFNGQFIDFSLANFGFVPYGQILSGDLFLTYSLDYCQQTDQNYKARNATKTGIAILVASRGKCSFSTQALNAQNVGYQMLIIVNDDSLLDNTLQQGGSLQINIPVIIISKNDGESLLDYLQKSEISVKIVFPSIQQTDQIKYEYWFNVGNASHYQFFEQFYEYHLIMKEDLQFTPHYIIPNFTLDEIQLAQQIDNTDSVNYQEIIRQLCIYQNYPLKWWNYVILYKNNCLWREPSQACINKLLNDLKMNKSTVDYCINKSYLESFHPSGNYSINRLLYEEAKSYQNQFANSTLEIWPVLFINKIQLKGSMFQAQNYKNDVTYFTPLQALCRTLRSKSPFVFRKCQEIIATYNLVENQIPEEENYFEDEKIGEIVAGVSVVWILIVISFCYCKSRNHTQ